MGRLCPNTALKVRSMLTTVPHRDLGTSWEKWTAEISEIKGWRWACVLAACSYCCSPVSLHHLCWTHRTSANTFTFRGVTHVNSQQHILDFFFFPFQKICTIYLDLLVVTHSCFFNKPPQNFLSIRSEKNVRISCLYPWREVLNRMCLSLLALLRREQAGQTVRSAWQFKKNKKKR